MRLKGLFEWLESVFSIFEVAWYTDCSIRPSIGLSSHLTPSILSVSQLVSATTPRNSMMP